MASGEDLPRGQSCRARLIILDFRRGDITKDSLTRLQNLGRSGAFARAMAAYIAWLAPQIDEIKKGLRGDMIAERDLAIRHGLAGSHDRVPDNVAQLMVGAKMAARFAQEFGAISDAGKMVDHMRQALYSLAESQGEHLKDQDEPVTGTIHDFTPDGINLQVPEGLVNYPFSVMDEKTRQRFFPLENARQMYRRKYLDVIKAPGMN